EADVRYVGRVEKLQAPRERTRPLVPGLSVGHVDITAGTLGCFVEAAGGVSILSNNHVLADENRAAIGDAIVQPGRADGGEPPGDVVAELAAFVPLDVEGANLVDAAVATVVPGIEVRAGELPGGGALSAELVEPAGALGLDVVKEGRTTGRTAGVVTAFNVSNLLVQYDISSAVRFDGQIEVQAGGEEFSMGGDSGSLIVTAEDFRPVALLFAGSDQGGEGGAPVTYANPIGAVMDGLGATLHLGP
ncbi:MAG TPA: hypothetical protein VN213_09265, partial [Solirubrobacteraceae bacterium]|nr:hypothetical protein [Solirubrobacteraceae bacterium]